MIGGASSFYKTPSSGKKAPYRGIATRAASPHDKLP